LIKLIDVANERGLALGPVALAACMQIGACTPNHVIQEMGFQIHYNDGSDADITSYIRNPEIWTPRDGGYIPILAGPGLGIEVDEEQVRRRAVEYKDAKTWVNEGFVSATGEVREW
jgi:galactonate dehydratase